MKAIERNQSAWITPKLEVKLQRTQIGTLEGIYSAYDLEEAITEKFGESEQGYEYEISNREWVSRGYWQGTVNVYLVGNSEKN